jgi:hypothetical protein
VPLFLYPFLNTVSKTRPFEYLRLTSLGVIGALVKVDDTDVINFLLSTEIIPLCLRTMEMGSELSKTVATFIVQKILLDDVSWGGHKRGCRVCCSMWVGVCERASSNATWVCCKAALRVSPQAAWPAQQCAWVRGVSGKAGTVVCKAAMRLLLLPSCCAVLWCCAAQVGLNYICATAERFFAVGAVLGNMVVMLAEQPSPRLLKHIIRCYLRLSDNPRCVVVLT